MEMVNQFMDPTVPKKFDLPTPKVPLAGSSTTADGTGIKDLEISDF